jgi:hypothetical protein
LFHEAWLPLASSGFIQHPCSGLVVVGINIEEDSPDVREFVADQARLFLFFLFQLGRTFFLFHLGGLGRASALGSSRFLCRHVHGRRFPGKCIL